MNDNQTPRDWLLDRHRPAEPKLDALRQAALPSADAKRHPGWAWRLLFPVATGLAAVWAVGIYVYQAKPSAPTQVPVAVIKPAPVPRAEPPRAVAAPTAPSGAAWAQPAMEVPIVSSRVPESAPGASAPVTRIPRQNAGAASAGTTTVPSTVDKDVGVVALAPIRAPGAGNQLYPPSAFTKDASSEPKAEPTGPEAQPGWRPVATWTNAGAATPSAAMETWLWADVNRRADVWLSTVAITGSVREKIVAYYDGLPEAERAKYATPEEMYALMSMGMHPLSWTGMGNLKETVSAQRINERQPANGPATEVVVSLDWQWADGRVRPDSRTFRRMGDGWKMPITDSMVEGVFNFYRSRPLPEAKKGTFRRVPG